MNESKAIAKLERIQQWMLNQNILDWPSSICGHAKWDTVYMLDGFIRDFKYGPKCHICFKRANA